MRPSHRITGDAKSGYTVEDLNTAKVLTQRPMATYQLACEVVEALEIDYYINNGSIPFEKVAARLKGLGYGE